MLNTILRNLVCVGLVAVFATPTGSRVAWGQNDLPPPPPPPPPSADVPPPPPADMAPPPPMDPPPEMDVPPPPSPADEAPRSATKVNKDTAKVVINSKGSDAVPYGQELVNMDFPEPTEIKDIIRAVALWTGKNVILDRNVSGKIQIISPKRVTKEEAYQAFLSALNVMQFTTVETGKIIKIMPIRNAIKGNLRTFLGNKWTPLTDEIITQIVPLKYVDSKSIQNTLNRIISPNSMVAYEKTNTLIISDSGYKVRRILDILDLIDVQGQQPQVSFVPIRFADAKTVVDRVSEILKANSAGGGSYGAFKLMTDERSNSVIVFGPPRTITDVQTLVKKFDIELDDPTRQSSIHVRPLEYADAKKIASTLSSLAQGNKKRTGPASFSPVNIPGAPGGAASQASAPSTAELDDNTKITADEGSNSLLITGSRASYHAVNSIIRKLDIRRSQVFVEADILDLTTSNGFAFGTSIFAGTKAGQNPVITTWQGGQMAPIIAASGADTSKLSTPEKATVANSFAQDMTIGILSGQSVTIPGIGSVTPGALIKMIKTDVNTRVLSSPHIMTANNEEAKISVGKRVFFRTASDANPTTGVSTPKVEHEDVELSLGIKPNISNTNYVTMKVDIESNSVDGQDPDSKLPIIKKRKSGQTMTVKNGQTIVISGLVEKSESESFSKIPLLGDIPILGWLFRNSSISHSTNNMVIFLTPHVIHGADDLAAIYQSKLKERDEYLEYVYGKSFKDDRFYAMLPKAEDGVYQEDEADKDEKQRREAVLKQIREDDAGMTPSPGVSNEQKESMVTPTPVPMNASLGGHSDSGGVSLSPPPSGGGSSLPPPPGGSGGDDFVPEPPPPPEMPSDSPPID